MRIVTAETAADLARAASLIEAYFRSWGLDDPRSDPDLADELDGLRAYRGPDGAVLVALSVAGEPMGVVALKRVDDATCEMKRMFVPEPFRRRGVGRALVAGLMLRAGDAGYRRMRLDTPDDNVPALAMYRTFGFTPIESYLDPDHGHAHDDWAWLAADLPATPRARQALQRVRLEAAYLAEDDPRAGSGFTGDEARWKAKRRVIVRALERDGTFLDACCANGYLMESVERWAREDGLKIEPHGLDVSARLVAEARRRLAAWSDRIHVGDAFTWEPPRRYDAVYTLLDVVLHDEREAYVRRLLARAVEPGGRLVVGMYDDDAAARTLGDLALWGLEPAGVVRGEVVEGSATRRTTVAWIPKEARHDG